MKITIRIAQEERDELIRAFLKTEIEVRFLRLNGKEKEKDLKMLERDNLELRINLLDEYIKYCL